MMVSISDEVASIVFAAGKGSRMTGYEGNKTLLPLVPARSAYEGSHSLLAEVLMSLPAGPKGIVVHHRADDVQKETEDLGCSYLLQPKTNGTGGALLAARPFLEAVRNDRVVITMGDVPLIHPATYERLVRRLSDCELAVLAFVPRDRAQYGMIEMEGDRVARIVEWKYWSTYPPSRLAGLKYCNAGVYAAGREMLLRYMTRLASAPHCVRKQREDRWVEIEEYFLTDLVELICNDGLTVALVEASEEEVVGVDTPDALKYVQEQYAKRAAGKSSAGSHDVQ
jgi:bifunctional UDP-N-acetylglucosamine pyrophosphorylase / glucosamine-1-phosphate N-acetyltransferase